MPTEEGNDRDACGLRPVGTRGGCGEGRGPRACPGADEIASVWRRRQGPEPPPRTSTRPPHPYPSSPCPYRTRTPAPPLPHSGGTIHHNEDAPHSPIRVAHIIRNYWTHTRRLLRPHKKPFSEGGSEPNRCTMPNPTFQIPGVQNETDRADERSVCTESTITERGNAFGGLCERSLSSY